MPPAGTVCPCGNSSRKSRGSAPFDARKVQSDNRRSGQRHIFCAESRGCGRCREMCIRDSPVFRTLQVGDTVVPFEDLVELSGEGIMEIDQYLGITED